MEAFVESARYAREAKSYDLVMTGTRHYWNTCLPLLNEPAERMFLLEQLKFVSLLLRPRVRRPDVHGLLCSGDDDQLKKLEFVSSISSEAGKEKEIAADEITYIIILIYTPALPPSSPLFDLFLLPFLPTPLPPPLGSCFNASAPRLQS